MTMDQVFNTAAIGFVVTVALGLLAFIVLYLSRWPRYALGIYEPETYREKALTEDCRDVWVALSTLVLLTAFFYAVGATVEAIL